MGVKVREKPRGSGTWWIFIHHNGKRKAKRVGAEKAARSAAEKIQARLTLNEFDMGRREPRCSTFKEYAEMWLALPHEWKDATRDSYTFNLNLHVYPKFGKTPIDQIKRKDLKAFFDELLIGGLHPSTVSLIRAPMSGVFSHAVDSEVIETNPLRELRVKARGKALEVDPLTEDEAALLLEKAKQHLGGYYYPHILCALRTGMRIGEMEALQTGDIDFNGRFIEVRRSNRRGKVTDTKNHKRRRVDMTPQLAETLKALKVTQAKAALKRGKPTPEWVFAGSKGEMLERMAFTKALNQCLKLAELRRIRVHDLRHTYATIRLLRGHNVGDVSYQLGHSSISW